LARGKKPVGCWLFNYAALTADIIQRCFSNCGPQAVSEERALQKLYQTQRMKNSLNMSVLILSLLLDLQPKVSELALSITLFCSRVSSGSIVSYYGLDYRAIGFRSSAGTKDFPSILCVQTGSGVHPASCTVGTGGPFQGVKARPGRDADHSPPSSAEVENE
jgi:hypothetical protein